VADDYRPFVGPQVGNHPGRNLEQEHGGLHHRAGQDKLKVVEPGDLESIEGRDRKRHGRYECGDRRESKEDTLRARHMSLQ
jgi:hypothetical protein